MKMNKKIAE